MNTTNENETPVKGDLPHNAEYYLAREMKIWHYLTEAMGHEACEGCDTPQLVAILISQRDNARSEANCLKASAKHAIEGIVAMYTESEKRIATDRDTAIARVKELEAAIAERVAAKEEYDSNSGVTCLRCGEADKQLKRVLAAAARAAGTGEEGQ